MTQHRSGPVVPLVAVFIKNSAARSARFARAAFGAAHKIKNNELKLIDVGRLRFELRTSRLKAGCSTAELATRFVKLSTYEIIPF